MNDAEWAFFAPFLIENRSRGGRRPQDLRKVLDGIFWITRTGSPWRDLPAEFGNWNSIHHQYSRWTEAGVWDVMLAALAESDAADTTMQMIDSTIVRAHQHAAGGKGDSQKRYWPFARWAHDQASYPDGCAGPRPSLLPDAGPSLGHGRLRGSDAEGGARSGRDAGRQGL